tara:strand:- start:7444 stop:7884 length:441 start_codon:yes stop_codon:yes gene_type:complete
MAVDSTKAVESLGAIKTIIKQFGKITSSMGGGNNVDISQTVLENIGGRPEFINGQQFELIKGIFQQHTDNENLATAYALLTTDAMKKFNTEYEQLFEQINNEDGSVNLRFSQLGVALLNNYRPSTSQIGIKVAQNTQPYVARNIIV